MKKTRFCQILLYFCGIFAFISCERPANYREYSGSIWHTVFNITYRSDRNLNDSIMAVMRCVEHSLSPFIEESLISAVNRGEPVTADTLIIKVFDGSAQVWEQSGGAFDPTVAPLVNLWGFGWAERPDSLAPSQAEIDSVRASVGMGECGIAPDGSIVKKSPATMFNFSAITKGLGCDEVGAMLERNGCRDYMVEIGGEMALRGVNRYGEPWHVMIDSPQECDTAVVHNRLTIIEISNCGIATSGNYRNYRDTNRGRVGHSINPATGLPQPTSTLSATVIAPTCMLADAYATACMVMPSDSALRMIERQPSVEALLVVAAPDSTMALLRSSGFPSK